jgi:hypothetical protein
MPVFLIGYAGVLFPSPPSAPDFILPHMILETGLPVLVVGLFCAGALSASMSTGDAVLHAAASVAVEDGLRPVVRLRDAQQRFLMRVLVVAIGGIAYYFAIIQQQTLVWLLLTAYGIDLPARAAGVRGAVLEASDVAWCPRRPRRGHRGERFLPRARRPAPVRYPRGHTRGVRERGRPRSRESAGRPGAGRSGGGVRG